MIYEPGIILSRVIKSLNLKIQLLDLRLKLLKESKDKPLSVSPNPKLVEDKELDKLIKRYEEELSEKQITITLVSDIIRRAFPTFVKTDPFFVGSGEVLEFKKPDHKLFQHGFSEILGRVTSDSSAKTSPVGKGKEKPLKEEDGDGSGVA